MPFGGGRQPGQPTRPAECSRWPATRRRQHSRTATSPARNKRCERRQCALAIRTSQRPHTSRTKHTPQDVIGKRVRVTRDCTRPYKSRCGFGIRHSRTSGAGARLANSVAAANEKTTTIPHLLDALLPKRLDAARCRAPRPAALILLLWCKCSCTATPPKTGAHPVLWMPPNAQMWGCCEPMPGFQDAALQMTTHFRRNEDTDTRIHRLDDMLPQRSADMQRLRSRHEGTERR